MLLKLVVLYLVLCTGQFVAKMPHGGQEQRDSQFVTPDMSGLFLDLRHPDNITAGVDVIECG
jgi:hypothetical protein